MTRSSFKIPAKTNSISWYGFMHHSEHKVSYKIKCACVCVRELRHLSEGEREEGGGISSHLSHVVGEPSEQKKVIQGLLRDLTLCSVLLLLVAKTTWRHSPLTSVNCDVNESSSEETRSEWWLCGGAYRRPSEGIIRDGGSSHHHHAMMTTEEKKMIVRKIWVFRKY